MAKDSDDSDPKPSIVLMDHIEKERARAKEQLNEVQREGEEAVTKANAEITRLQDEKDQMENEVKAPLIAFLDLNSKGAFIREDLLKLNLETLKKLKSRFVDAVNSGYDEILKQRQTQRDSENKPRGTVGAWNQETQEFEGGI